MRTNKDNITLNIQGLLDSKIEEFLKDKPELLAHADKLRSFCFFSSIFISSWLTRHYEISPNLSYQKYMDKKVEMARRLEDFVEKGGTKEEEKELMDWYGWLDSKEDCNMLI